MKLILLIAIVGFSSSNAFLADTDYGEKLLGMTKTWHNKCVPITGVTQETIEGMRNGSFVEEEKLKRYTLCLWLVSGVMNPDLTLNTNSLKELIPKKIATHMKAYLECAKIAKESGIAEPHEMVWKLMKCVYNENPAGFVMF